MKQTVTYTTHIAGNKHSQAFDHAKGKTPESAATALKRRNSPDWKDYCVWVTGPDGYHKTMYDNGN